MTQSALVIVRPEDLTPTGLPRCQGLKPDGGRGWAFAGTTGFCYWHDPRFTDDDHRRAHVRAGKQRSNHCLLAACLRRVRDRGFR